MLLQSPAHRVMRVLDVTQSNWHVKDKRGGRRSIAPNGSMAPPMPAKA